MHETTETVTEILHRWSKSKDAKPAGHQPKSPPDINGASSDIVTAIVNDLHHASDMDSNISSLDLQTCLCQVYSQSTAKSFAAKTAFSLRVFENPI